MSTPRRYRGQPEAMALLGLGYEVQVAVDGISSRESVNKEVSLLKMTRAGVSPTTTEMALFDMRYMKSASF
jgi:hypothetical protein